MLIPSNEKLFPPMGLLTGQHPLGLLNFGSGLSNEHRSGRKKHPQKHLGSYDIGILSQPEPKVHYVLGYFHKTGRVARSGRGLLVVTEELTRGWRSFRYLLLPGVEHR